MNLSRKVAMILSKTALGMAISSEKDTSLIFLKQPKVDDNLKKQILDMSIQKRRE